MYERFTNRAREVMQKANAAAKRMDASIIERDHLAMGLLQMEDGIAGTVLDHLGLDRVALVQALERRLEAKARATETQKSTGPSSERSTIARFCEVFLSKRRLSHTRDAMKVVEDAILEARALGHSYVGTEHLLLGLLRESAPAAGDPPLGSEVDIGRVREGVRQLLGHGSFN